LGQESEEVHQILAASAEALAQFFVLCRHPYGAGVLVTFAHHYATQYDQGAGGETEFFGSEHCHQYDVTACFELSVHFQHHLSAQAVQQQCLLRIAQTEFGRDTCIADGLCRRSSRTTLCTRDDCQIGLCLCHSGCNGAHTA